MNPAGAAKHWWDSLTPDQRLKVARNAGLVHRTPDTERLWALSWDELMPFSQQKELQRHYDEIIAAGTDG